MCGIYGEVGRGDVLKNAIDGLKALEYRGYDSAGIAFFNELQRIKVTKQKGMVASLEAKAGVDRWATRCPLSDPLDYNAVIAHTRWATHGKPASKNSHPFKQGRFVVAHNGIIENYKEFKTELENRFIFQSETDSEVIAALLEEEYSKLWDSQFTVDEFEEGFIDILTRENKDMTLEAIYNVSKKLKGAYALAILSEDVPNTIFATTNNPPLIVGSHGDATSTFVVTSDEAALPANSQIYRLKPGEIATLDDNAIKIYESTGEGVAPKGDPLFQPIQAKQQPSKDGYPHFMKKEINEIEKSLRATLESKDTEQFKRVNEFLKTADTIYLSACGTAYHACLLGKHYIEKNLGKQVVAEVASELRYMEHVGVALEGDPHKVAAIFVSQSGETADTIAAAELFKKQGAKIITITNNPNSTLANLSDEVININAGKEVAVAATKSFTSQAFAFNLLTGDTCVNCLEPFFAEAKRLQENTTQIKELVEKYKKVKNIFFIGRLADYATSKEASLKLKEISYIHSEAYQAGELKHGTIALIESKSVVCAIITDPKIKDKTMNAVYEVKARGAKTIVISPFTELKDNAVVDDFIEIRNVMHDLIPILSVIPMFNFAYYFSKQRGIDPDKPRNLAKSVTVE
ncbi:MAG: glutamine--fructose-6-phosphate transaminase (isomerizing) [Firmicutes bacterium]|nr:glutamine--fructose-6-phosphate transaminase (isomerizing) [Bacillota bacterium]